MQHKDVKDTIDAYSKLSNDELMAELVKHMSAQKAKDGGVNMRQTIERIKPLLNDVQRKRLDEILQKIGNI